MTVLPLPSHGRWARDVRGEGRAVRVSAHAEAGLVTVSVWRGDTCVGAVRLEPGEAAELVAGVAEALAHLTRTGDTAGPPRPPGPPGPAGPPAAAGGSAGFGR